MADKELLEAMRAMMKEELEPIRTDIANLKDDIAGLQQGQKALDTKMADGFARVDGKFTGLRQGQTDLQSDIIGLRTEMEKGFQETRETVWEIVDVIDKKLEHSETTA